MSPSKGKMKRRLGTSEVHGSPQSPSEPSHRHSQFLQMAAQQHLTDLRREASQSPSKSKSNASPLPNQSIIPGPEPEPEPARKITESKNSHKQQQEQELHRNGKRKRRIPKRDTSNNNNKRRRRKLPDIPPPNSHTERDLFYIVHLTSCQIGSHLLCPPPPTDEQLPMVASLNQGDSLILQTYREMQLRFNTGFSLSTLATLHQQLKTNYCKAIKILSQSSNTDTINGTGKSTPIDGSINDALSLRNELAGLWILYAHVLLEMGLGLCQQQQQHQEQKQQKLPGEEQQPLPAQGTHRTSTTNNQQQDGQQESQQEQQQQHQETNPTSSTHSPAKQDQQQPEQREQFLHQLINLIGWSQTPSRRVEQQQELQQQDSIGSSSTQSPVQQIEYPLSAAADDGATSPELSVQDVLNYVSAVLQVAGQCPMVGNHKYIALALGRIMVVETVLGASIGRVPNLGIPIKMKSETLRDTITAAIKAGQQTLELCHGMTLANQQKGPKLPDGVVLDSIQKFCHCLVSRPFAPNDNGETEETWLTAITIKQDMLCTLALPDQLMLRANMTTPLTKDPHTARVICHEINRWCRLREKLDKRVYTFISPCLDYRSNSFQSVMATQLMDQFQFYRTMDCPLDVWVQGAKWTDLEYVSPGEDGGFVQWNW